MHERRNGFECGTAEGVEHRATGGGERRCRRRRRVFSLTNKRVWGKFFRNLCANWGILERKSLLKLLGQIQINIVFITTSVRLSLIVHNLCAGMTALLMKILLEPGLFNYDKLYVFAKSLYQPEYQVLKAGLENGLPKTDII